MNDSTDEKPTGEAIFQIWHGTSEPWGGCADRENVERVQQWFDEREAAVRASAIAEAEEQVQERFAALNTLLLQMRDRVMGYMSAPPVARMFTDGGHAFEWAATNVRRVADGAPVLNPPVPISPLRPGESEENVWRRHVLTCATCGERFTCAADVRIEHAEHGHLGRIPSDADETVAGRD